MMERSESDTMNNKLNTNITTFNDYMYTTAKGQDSKIYIYILW